MNGKLQTKSGDVLIEGEVTLPSSWATGSVGTLRVRGVLATSVLDAPVLELHNGQQLCIEITSTNSLNMNTVVGFKIVGTP